MIDKDCTDFEILISAAIDGELEPGEFEVLESHVEQCDGCRSEYLKLESLTDMLLTHERWQDQRQQANDFSTDLATDLTANQSNCSVNKQLVETSSRTPLPVGDMAGDGNSNNGLVVNGHAKADKPTAASQSGGRDSGNESGFGRNFLAGGMLVATAAGLAALLTPPSLEPLPALVPIADVALPAERATILHEQTRSLQASKTRALDQELRTLKLMLVSCDASPEQVALIKAKVEEIEKRVRLLGASYLNP